MPREFKSVLHINEKAGRFGGTEEYVDSLTEICSNKGIKSYLICGVEHGERHPNLILFSIPGLEDRDARKDISKRVMDIVHKIKPDIVYIHNIFDWRIVQALAAANKQYVLLWYIHDHYPTCLTELRSVKSEEVVCKEALSKDCLNKINEGYCIKRYADRNYNISELNLREKLLNSMRLIDIIIVISNYMKETILKNIPALETKIKFVPRQVRQPNILARKTNLELHLGYAGRITYEKGLHLILEALLMLPDNLKFTFSIAGVKENPEYWEKCLELIKKIEEEKPNINIQDKGFLSYKDTDALYRTMDIAIVAPIWGEPTCTVVAEALVNGAAVIVSNVGGVSTFAKHMETGFLVKPNNPAAIAEAIKTLVKDRNLLAKIAKQGKSLISNEFTAEKHFEALNNAIQQI